MLAAPEYSLLKQYGTAAGTELVQVQERAAAAVSQVRCCCQMSPRN